MAPSLNILGLGILHFRESGIQNCGHLAQLLLLSGFICRAVFVSASQLSAAVSGRPASNLHASMTPEWIRVPDLYKETKVSGCKRTAWRANVSLFVYLYRWMLTFNQYLAQVSEENGVPLRS